MSHTVGVNKILLIVHDDVHYMMMFEDVYRTACIALHCFFFSPASDSLFFASMLICTFNIIIKWCLCMRARLFFFIFTLFRCYATGYLQCWCLLFQPRSNRGNEKLAKMPLTSMLLQWDQILFLSKLLLCFYGIAHCATHSDKYYSAWWTKCFIISKSSRRKGKAKLAHFK